MRRIMAAGAVVCLAGALAGNALARGRAGRADAAAGDGFIGQEEACTGGADFASQDDTFRPWGGVLVVPSGLALDRRAALSEALRMRREASGAVWRIVTADGPLPVGHDGLLVASCGAELPGLAFVHRNPSGSLAVRWDAAPTGEVAQAISEALAKAEGNGPI